MNEADTCRKFVVPLLQAAGWDLLENYAIDGGLQFTLPDVLKVAPIWRHGNVAKIACKFGGVDELRNAVNQLQTLLYAI
jgi:type I restriction enzyme R subunit